MKYKVVPTKKFKKEYNLAIKKRGQVENLSSFTGVKSGFVTSGIVSLSLHPKWKLQSHTMH